MSTATIDLPTRVAQLQAHNVFDPLWIDGHFPSRKAAYRWLREQLGITKAECHISHFDAATCARVITLCQAQARMGQS